MSAKRCMNQCFKARFCLVVAFMLSIHAGTMSNSHAMEPKRKTFALDANASGVIETINNIDIMMVESKDANDLKAEYRAGFVQGKLQDKTIRSARDNSWDNAYLTDEQHSFPHQLPPTAEELNKARCILLNNYDAFILLLRNPATDADDAF